MCLITFAYQTHPNFPLIVVANRDEFYERPSKQAHYWPDAPTIFAGRDLQSNGTWLGVTKDGQFAAVTNYRDPSLPDIGEKSRGELVHQFLNGVDLSIFLKELHHSKAAYGGYNFIGYAKGQMIHYNNILDEGGFVEPGIHAVSNASLNTPWPKVTFAKSMLEQNLYHPEQLPTILLNKTIAPDSELPDTGVGLHLERILSAPFVQTSGYGTRSNATIWLDENEAITLTEQLFEEGVPTAKNTYKISP